MSDITLRQMKDRIANLTPDEMRQILATREAEGMHETFDMSDFYDMLMAGIPGYENTPDDAVRKEFADAMEGYDLQDQYDIVTHILDD